jgi:preprotein translocase subunit SecE
MPAFELYKPDQAVTSRWIFAASVGALVLFGGYQLFYWLPEGVRGHAFSGFRPFGEEFPISWALVIAVVWVLGGLFGAWWAVNHPRLVDFFTETELEMTKVSWSSRREVIGSSLVVLATVVILGVWIALVDIILSRPWAEWIGSTFGRLFRG